MDLTIEVGVQIVLIVVLIFQVGYLAKQTNFFRRSSQANLMETWLQEFRELNFEKLYPENPDSLPDENEFQKLVNTLHRMHFYFREKLLKPSDFAMWFTLLLRITKYEELRKTATYYENYVNLQNIFNDFNKDVDAVMYLFTLPTTSLYEEIFDQIPLFQKHEKLKKTLIGNAPSLFTGFRIKIWWDIHMRKKSTFPLDPPLFQPKGNS